MDFAAETVALLSASPVTVKCPAGDIIGTRTASTDAFLGIRYGTVPGRFQPSHSFNYGTSMHALTYGATCYQATAPLKPQPGTNYSEQCLYLNMYTPSLQIAFWIHGGGFTQACFTPLLK